MTKILDDVADGADPKAAGEKLKPAMERLTELNKGDFGTPPANDEARKFALDLIGAANDFNTTMGQMSRDPSMAAALAEMMSN